MKPIELKLKDVKFDHQPKKVKATVNLRLSKAMALGLDYIPTKNEFTATVNDIKEDEFGGLTGYIKYQGKKLIVESVDGDITYFSIENLA